MINSVICGDCMDVLRSMDDCSVDMIITDPPYGIDFQSARVKNPQDRFKKIANDKRPFIWWIYDAARVLKVGGGVLCFSRWDVQQQFIDALTISGLQVKSCVVWDRVAHGMGDLKGSFAPCHDVILFAVKGRYEFPSKRPKDVVRANRVPSAQLVHPNEKPISLMKELIECTTRQGDIVLDPFAGSGSTLVAAAQCERNYIGIELSKEYCEIARKRIDELKGKLDATN